MGAVGEGRGWGVRETMGVVCEVLGEMELGRGAQRGAKGSAQAGVDREGEEGSSGGGWRGVHTYSL